MYNARWAKLRNQKALHLNDNNGGCPFLQIFSEFSCGHLSSGETTQGTRHCGTRWEDRRKWLRQRLLANPCCVPRYFWESELPPSVTVFSGDTEAFYLITLHSSSVQRNQQVWWPALSKRIIMCRTRLEQKIQSRDIATIIRN